MVKLATSRATFNEEQAKKLIEYWKVEIMEWKKPQ